jgi:hypothetical protein
LLNLDHTARRFFVSLTFLDKRPLNSFLQKRIRHLLSQTSNSFSVTFEPRCTGRQLAVMERNKMEKNAS